MIDNDQVAVEVATKNGRANGVQGVSILLSDGFGAVKESGFSQILCSPPYHVDFAVPKRFIHKGFNRLVLNGTFWVVTQRETWYRNKLRSIFGTRMQARSNGLWSERDARNAGVYPST